MSRNTSIAFRVTAIYLVVSGLWIAFSDMLLYSLVSDPSVITRLQTIKGWAFVTATAVLIFALVRRSVRIIYQSEQKLQQSYQELSAANEELIATEEELRQQFDELVTIDEKIRRQNEFLHSLHETALVLMNELDVGDLLATVVQKAVNLGRSPHGYIYLYDPVDDCMELRVKVGTVLEDIGFKQRCGDGVVGKVWETGEPLVVYDYHQWEGRLPDAYFDPLRTSLGIPLKSGGEVIGVFGLNFTDDRLISEEELTWFRAFAELASIAMDNARLHSEVRDELAERLRVEAALQTNQARTRALIEAVPDIILRLDREGVLLDYKRGADFNFVIDFSARVGQNIRDFVPQEIADKFILSGKAALATQSTQVFEYEMASDGGGGWREVRAVVCGQEEVLAIIRDITERAEMERQLKFMSLHDRVTGLYNRAFFEEELRRLNDSRFLPTGMIVFDIDGLKLVNDTLGHAAGDELLKTASDIILGCFGAGDVVARIGGDEFAAVLPNRELAAVEHICRLVRETVAEYSASASIPLSISIGMSVRASLDESLDECFKQADNSMYREKLHRTQSARSAIVQTLAKALAARDFVTEGHADRLQDLMEQLAVAIGLPESDLPDLRLLGHFHDIGKVGIPDHILFKPGRLTPEEFEIMKRHSEIGYRIAQASPELAPIADWILKHQEWWNGKGYPLGIKGEEIPLPCRMLAIVDAYDAMTNDRPYRKALTEDETVAELKRCAGEQFDPVLVDSFLKIIETK